MQDFDYSQRPGLSRNRIYSPKKEEALVTVVTPYYNAGKYFEETFNSVMNQTFPWFEWIIINDGSTNQEDIDILNRFAEKDARIQVVNQENGGLSCARNTGFKNAHTELIVPLDADDLISPQYLECLYWALYYNPEASWAYTDCVGFQGQEYRWKKKFDAKKMTKDNLLVATAMIRRQAFEDVGGYKIEKWSYNEDWRFWLELLELHRIPVHVPLDLFWYRRLEGGMLSTIIKHDEQKKFSEKIISDAGKKADTSIKAIEYPIIQKNYSFYRAEFIKWEKYNDIKSDETRVLWLIPQMVMGGADKFNLDAIRGLSALNYKNYILTTEKSENTWKQKFENYTDEIYCMEDFLDPNHYMEYTSYMIQSRQIDVLMVTNSYIGYYMLPWIRQHFPNLVIVDYVHMEEWYWRAGGYARTSAAVHGITERTFVCNSATRNVLIDTFKCNKDDVECLYIGVDHRYYDRSNEEGGYLHKLAGIELDRPIVLLPCRIHEQKRPLMVIDIAFELRKKMPSVAFVVVGDGPQLSELEGLIKHKGLQKTVYCVGRSNQMRSCYRDSDVVLICSLNEGLALTAYEACSMAVPIVSSDVGGQRDLIGDDVGALIPTKQAATDISTVRYDKQEVEAFAEKLFTILNDRQYALQLGNEGRKKIVERFSIEVMVDKLDKEIQILINDVVRKERREQLSKIFETMPSLMADYHMIYLEWDKPIHDLAYMNILYKTYDLLMKIPLINIPVKEIGKILYKMLLS